MKRLFIIALAIVVIFAGSMAGFLFYSLLPHVQAIGNVGAGVVIWGLLCIGVLMGAFTYSKVCNLLNRRNLIVHGEVVAYLTPAQGFVHLSAMHESAKVPQLPPVKEVEALPAPSDEQTILELHKKGIALRDIATLTNNTFYRVQKVTSEKG